MILLLLFEEFILLVLEFLKISTVLYFTMMVMMNVMIRLMVKKAVVIMKVIMKEIVKDEG